MKKRRFPRISPTMARRVVLVLIALTALLSSGCMSGDDTSTNLTCRRCKTVYDDSDEKQSAVHEEVHSCKQHRLCEIGDEDTDIHETECNFCDGYLCTGDHGDGICNKQEEPPKEEDPPAATCQVCQGTLAEGESHAAPCGNNAHCTKDGKSHEKLTCGHYTCDGKKHDKLACGHYTCDGKKHEKAACGHYVCDGASHGIAVCGVSGHFACDDGLHKKAPCGHWACNLSGEAADHEQCPDCGKYFCDGHTHALQCPGCGAEVGDTIDHMAPCRNAEHLTCAAGYVADSHVNYADCNAHTLCDSRDHSRCQCSIPKCSSQYVAAEHGLLVCGRHCKYNVPDDIEDTHTVNCPYA